MTRIKEAIAKLEAMKQEAFDKESDGELNYDYVLERVESILADLNVDDLDWKPS